MDKTYEDYSVKLENIIKNIKINNKKYKQKNAVKINISSNNELNNNEVNNNEVNNNEVNNNEVNNNEVNNNEVNNNEVNNNEVNNNELNNNELNNNELNNNELNNNELNNNKLNNNKLNNNKPAEKDFYCKQLDSLNYCLEMHKVRKNKKADFDIYSTLKYNIEDENIGKNVVFSNWKELDNNEQKNLIDIFIKEFSENNNLDFEYTKTFINNNLNKLKYDKYKKKIVDIHGMIKCNVDNQTILKIKIKDKKNTNISKLRKSLTSLKKNNIN